MVVRKYKMLAGSGRDIFYLKTQEYKTRSIRYNNQTQDPEWKTP